MPTEYEEQAEAFCKKHGVTLDIKRQPLDKKSVGTTEKVATYDVLMRRGTEEYQFTFYDSIHNTQMLKALEKGGRVGKNYIDPVGLGWTKTAKLRKEHTPNSYDILVTITKYDPGSFQDFCSEFGYNEDSKADTKAYNAIVEEYQNVARVLGNALEGAQEIT
jgi:CRISPR/Cas system-associated protein Cas5 (RAMP superfamily)